MKNYLTRKDNGFGWGLNFWEDPFENLFKPTFYTERTGAMKTDIRETEKSYELAVDMPGFEKSDISVTLNDGYLTVEAKKTEKEEDKNYLKRERSFSCSRSYYVGEEIERAEIKAKYDKGVLELTVPKKEQKEISPSNTEIE